MALTDISIGQYYPGNSPVHRMDPRMKLVLSFLYVVMLFLAGDFPREARTPTLRAGAAIPPQVLQ